MWFIIVLHVIARLEQAVSCVNKVVLNEIELIILEFFNRNLSLLIFPLKKMNEFFCPDQVFQIRKRSKIIKKQEPLETFNVNGELLSLIETLRQENQTLRVECSSIKEAFQEFKKDLKKENYFLKTEIISLQKKLLEERAYIQSILTTKFDNFNKEFKEILNNENKIRNKTNTHKLNLRRSEVIYSNVPEIKIFKPKEFEDKSVQTIRTEENVEKIEKKAFNDEINQVEAQIVYRTRTGSKFHNKYCGYLSQSCIAVSMSQARSIGLTPCSRCFNDRIF